mmetsp:Transcript_16971/g.2793  ORF Transcript_16971/g.2793 Transcript_16971/m.2793 type:complete len:108 (+) Transcript_16971:94-417(+)
MLQPDENFTVMNLSGSTPKVENVIKTLYVILGPDYMTDIITVETSDHASLSLKLSYNWVFDVDKNSQEQGNKIFSIRDFIGDTCKTMGSRIRAAVSYHTFESFHQDS